MSDQERSLFVDQHTGPYTDKELVPVLKKHLGEKFKGVIMGDQGARLRPLQPGNTWLVNLDSSDGGGTHWGISRVSTQRPGLVLWWDSLGFMPPRSITHGVRAQGNEIIASDARVQVIDQPNDALCGPRAVQAALMLAEDPKKDLQTFLDIVRD